MNKKFKYEKSKKYNTNVIMKRIMGPNPIKLLEELMNNNKTPSGATVMDLGSGQGVTSVFLAKEYGFRVYAADLWSNPDENRKFFTEMELSEQQIIPVKADALNLPFEKNFFDAVVSIDSYHYFGRNSEYLDNYLIPFVKPGGYIYIAIPGMKKDCHNNLPKELLLSWTPEDLDSMHDVEYWKNMMITSKYADIISIHEMISKEEVWEDWLNCENIYSKTDRKAMEAGGGKYLNFIAIILQKK